MPELLEEAIEHVVNEGFKPETLRRIVRKVLKEMREDEPKRNKKVERLELLAVKTLVKRMLHHTCRGYVFYALIFGESLEEHNFSTNGIYNKTQFHWPDSQEELQTMNREGSLMLEVMKHNVERFRFDEVTIRVKTETMRLIVDGVEVAKIWHREDYQFDTQHAMLFARLLLSYRIDSVRLEVDTTNEESRSIEFMSSVVGEIIGSLTPIHPGSTRETVESGNHRLYWRCAPRAINDRKYTVQFCCDDLYDEGKDYWGFIARD